MSHAFHGGQIDAAAREFGRTDFLDFSANINPFWSPADVTEWSHWLEGISHYPEAGASMVREQLATVYGTRRGWLLPTAGAIEGLYLAARLFTGWRVGIVEPAFADYARAFEAAGCEPSRLGLSPEQWDAPISEWGELLKPYEAIVLGRPNNPTGALQTREVLARTMEEAAWARAKGWVLDEAFIEFVPDHERESFLPVLERYPPVIVVRSLTKSWAIPGLRLGFVATANGEWLARLEKMQPPWGINAVAQAWAGHQLTPAKWREMLGTLRPVPALRADFAADLERLPGVRVHPGNANFLLVDVGQTGRCASEVYRALGREGLLVRVCEGFYGLDADRYIRVAVRRPEENCRLVRALAMFLGGAPAGNGFAPRPEVPPAPTPVRGTRRAAKPMKAVAVLGTSSNSGKSWVATALCAWLWRRGVTVAPFKAQNMSNNSYVTLDGGEIGRAQAAQAEACRLLPSVRMNPILLKPSGQLGSQLVVLGRARGHIKAGDYYALADQLWPVVSDALEHWRRTCDVLVLEGAGSLVELNLAARDIVNLRPVRHLDGKWLLVSDIERGGVFAQIVGSWNLLSPADRACTLGVIVNKFRGDLSLFADAAEYLAPHVEAPYLGVLPYRADLQPESEDSLCGADEERGTGETIAWVRFPHISNSQDCNAWSLDHGVRVRWVTKPDALAHAAAIVLPGSKNTIADLRWLRESGLAEAVTAAARRGVPVAGICGGYQMLGRRLADPEGTAGDGGDVPGLGLLPVETRFFPEKEARQVEAAWKNDIWTAYEIHMGRTVAPAGTDALLRVQNGAGWREEGVRCGNVWGTYLHGLFESPVARREFATLAGIRDHRAAEIDWRTHLHRVYDGMADLLEEHLNLEGIQRYVEA